VAIFAKGGLTTVEGKEADLMRNHSPFETVIKWAAWENRALNRREFLKRQLIGAFLFTGGATGLFLPKSLFADLVPEIGIAKGKPGSATRAAVDLVGGMRTFVKPGARVVIKPNLSFPQGPEAGTTTHPLVTREIVAMCLEAGASRIRVLDHPAEDFVRAETSIERTKEALKVFKKDMVFGLTKKDFFRASTIDGGLKFKETDVMRDVLEADVLIAAPVAKSHSMTGVSLAMKGMMGLIWNRETMHRDYQLDEAIVDLCTLLKADLTVVDATRVLSTGGPYGPGKVLRTNTVVASRDMVAADAKTVEMFEWYNQRFEPRQVEHIRLAHERRLGRMDVQNLRVKQIEV
jgi:uncharacterized protein (DUF362 family)